MSLIGIAVEIVTGCPRCAASLPINAMVCSVHCAGCDTNRPLSAADWQEFLRKALRDGPHAKMGAGQCWGGIGRSSTQREWTRCDPPFFAAGEDMEGRILPAAADQGYFADPAGGEPLSVRRLPAAFARSFPGVVYLVAEDFRQLPAEALAPGLTVSAAEQTQVFHCPGCGGALRVDGRTRAISCEFCAAETVLPDGIWRRLHPTTGKKRWFLVLDVATLPLRWHGRLEDVVCDDQGRVFIIHYLEDKQQVVAVGTDRRTLWKRRMKYPFDSWPASHLAAAPGGRLLVWNKNRAALTILSAEDGSRIARVGGKKDQQDPEDGAPLNLKGCRDGTVDQDGSFLIWYPASEPDEYGSRLYELARFSPDGARLPAWPEESSAFVTARPEPDPEPASPPEKQGLWARIAGVFHHEEGEPTEQNDTNQRASARGPERSQSEDTALAMGPDGGLYLARQGILIKYSPRGDVLFRTAVDTELLGRPGVLADGSALILCRTADGHSVLKVPAKGGAPQLFLASRQKGGVVGEENQLAVTKEGIIHLVGDDGRWRVVSATGELLYRSEESQDDDEYEEEDDEEDEDEEEEEDEDEDEDYSKRCHATD